MLKGERTRLQRYAIESTPARVYEGCCTWFTILALSAKQWNGSWLRKQPAVFGFGPVEWKSLKSSQLQLFACAKFGTQLLVTLSSSTASIRRPTRLMHPSIAPTSFCGAGEQAKWRRCGKSGGTCATRTRRNPIHGAGPQPKTSPAPKSCSTCAEIGRSDFCSTGTRLPVRHRPLSAARE